MDNLAFKDVFSSHYTKNTFFKSLSIHKAFYHQLCIYYCIHSFGICVKFRGLWNDLVEPLVRLTPFAVLKG